MHPILVPLLALAMAVLGHWSLARARRRVPLVLARRAGGPEARPDDGLVRRVALATLPVEAALWAAVAFLVFDAVPALRTQRDAIGNGLAMALGMPLFEADGHAYALRDVLAVPAILAVLWLAVGGAVHLVKTRVLEAVGVDRGVQEAVGTILRILGMVAGGLVVLQVWGIDLRTLAIAASVLGVGIGFGLQNIANNFVSGLLIGLERPVKPGDFVEVDGVQGTVERVGSRSTAIRTLDHVTILVPNAKLLEHEVVNWSHANGPVRLRVPVGVAYGSSIAAVRAALLEGARGQRGVLAEPRPRVELHGFGTSALEFELHVWTLAPREQHVLKSDLNHRIVASLARRGVTIPFSQHDVHFASPRLERILDAATARWLPEAAAAPVASPNTLVGADLGVDVDGPAWSDADVVRIAATMRGPGGVDVRDRRHRLAVYPRCFVGSDAVAWLMQAEDLERSDAVALGQAMIERGLVHHVLDEHGFQDGKLFYRFRADEAPAADAPAAEPSAAPTAAMPRIAAGGDRSS